MYKNILIYQMCSVYNATKMQIRLLEKTDYEDRKKLKILKIFKISVFINYYHNLP